MKIFETFKERIINESAVNVFKDLVYESVKISDKDWSRMVDLVVKDDDGEKVVKTLKDKNKAIARYVTGLKLIGKTPKYDESWGYTGPFSDFADKAIELGGTHDEILDAFNSINDVPEKWSEKLHKLKDKGLKSRYTSVIAKTILDMGFDFEISKGGYARTWAGKDAMEQNGRKWTIGYKAVVIDNNNHYDFVFDAITCEGGGATLYFVSSNESNPIFRDIYGSMGIRDFKDRITKVLNKLKNE